MKMVIIPACVYVSAHICPNHSSFPIQRTSDHLTIGEHSDMSRFATLLEEDDSDGDTDDARMSEPISSAVVTMSAAADSIVPRQSGGSYAQRADPVTGVDWGGTGPPVDTGFSDADVEACIRVVTGLGMAASVSLKECCLSRCTCTSYCNTGKNLNLFKLPALKPLRAALHPLIEEQMKNYAVKQPGDRSKSRGRKKRRLDGEGGGDLMEEQRRRLEALEEEYINQVSSCVSVPSCRQAC